MKGAFVKFFAMTKWRAFMWGMCFGTFLSMAVILWTLDNLSLWS